MSKKSTFLADAVAAVDFDINNPKTFGGVCFWVWVFVRFFCLFVCFVETSKFGHAFVPSFTAFSRETGVGWTHSSRA